MERILVEFERGEQGLVARTTSDNGPWVIPGRHCDHVTEPKEGLHFVQILKKTASQRARVGQVLWELWRHVDQLLEGHDDIRMSWDYGNWLQVEHLLFMWPSYYDPLVDSDDLLPSVPFTLEIALEGGPVTFQIHDEALKSRIWETVRCHKARAQASKSPNKVYLANFPKPEKIWREERESDKLFRELFKKENMDERDDEFMPLYAAVERAKTSSTPVELTPDLLGRAANLNRYDLDRFVLNACYDFRVVRGYDLPAVLKPGYYLRPGFYAQGNTLHKFQEEYGYLLDILPEWWKGSALFWCKACELAGTQLPGTSKHFRGVTILYTNFTLSINGVTHFISFTEDGALVDWF